MAKVMSDVIANALVRAGAIPPELSEIKSIRIELEAGEPARVTIVRYLGWKPPMTEVMDLLKGVEVHNELSTEERPDDRDQVS